jgi:hypothetical protein
VVGFVKHCDVPLLIEVIYCGQYVVLLGDVNGCDDPVVLLPDVLVRARLAFGVNVVTIVNDVLPVKLLLDLLLPLDGQRYRCDDEHAFGTATCHQFLDDDSGLDGLPETDLVPDELPVVVGTEDLTCGLHLVGLDVDSAPLESDEPVLTVCQPKFLGVQAQVEVFESTWSQRDSLPRGSQKKRRRVISI